MLKVKRYIITAALELDGSLNATTQRVVGTERILVPPLEHGDTSYAEQRLIVGEPAHMAYASGYGVRITTPLTCWHEDEVGIILITRNLIYVLTEVVNHE